MPEDPESDSQTENPSSAGRGTFPAGDSIRASMQVVSEALGGTAGAFSEGFRAFADELSRDSVRERGLVNAIFEGVIESQARFLRSLAETGDRVQESLRDLDDGEPR